MLAAVMKVWFLAGIYYGSLVPHIIYIPSSGVCPQLYDYIASVTERSAEQANQHHIPHICKVDLAIPSQHASSAMILYTKMTY